MTTSYRGKRQHCCKGFVCQLANLATATPSNRPGKHAPRYRAREGEVQKEEGVETTSPGAPIASLPAKCQAASTTRPLKSGRRNIGGVASAGTSGQGGTSCELQRTNAWNAWWRATYSHHSWHQQASRVHPLQANSHHITDTSDIRLPHPVRDLLGQDDLLHLPPGLVHRLHLLPALPPTHRGAVQCQGAKPGRAQQCFHHKQLHTG